MFRAYLTTNSGYFSKQLKTFRQFLSAFASSQKAPVTLVMSVHLNLCLSVRMHVAARQPAGRIFVKFDIVQFKENVYKIPICL